jgi:hypothetical protein
MFQGNHFVFHQIYDEVMSNVNMFGPAVLDGILGNVDGTEIITEQCHDILRDIVLSEHLFHLNQLGTTASSSYVFSLCSGQRNTILLLAEPRYEIVSLEETSS